MSSIHSEPILARGHSLFLVEWGKSILMLVWLDPKLGFKILEREGRLPKVEGRELLVVLRHRGQF